MGKPNFIIIGAMRSATSTLSSYLFEHPKVHIVEGKEVHFFSDEKIYNQGADWYFSKFYNAPEGEIVGEASPSYLATSVAPGRVKNLLPDVKIILCVRNPGERSISHFFWNKSIQLEQHSFEDMFSDDNICEANHYIGNSMYAKHFYWWLHFFDPSQIAVVFFDDIVNRPQKVMSELFDFLNVNPINLSSTIHHHPTDWQDEPHKYKEVLFKINQYVHSDILTFLQDLKNSGVRVVGEPESIRHSYVGEIHEKKPMISTIQDNLCRLAAYSGEPWLPSHEYFIKAEAHIDRLWESLIWPFIDDCDFSNVLDLAAGHGRNSRKLLESAKSDHLVILDIQEGNIEVCKQRFPNWSNINYIVGSGYDLCGLDDNSISLVYCFDAMVHFAPEVVQSYLIEIYRILREGGRAFLHHSNYTGGKDWKVNPNGRNYMSASLFTEYAQEANLQVVRQRIINWGGSENIDCLSLVEKYD
ncbi:methyltransferase domain-containing protein [Planktothrix agardhii 1029]|uniref:sulfotransferase domain-containing protein n=1 Tax=Planktothrix agardhii TaxID=1160 RepID=UPI001F399452|nr:sulfotransferase domain-containing protein [Planktothrix agardhii]MCF3591023.1 methyltransferase domain-containing protein [Planktothrix agardhii 1029]MCF3619512.1 methyltransferase domain-containing protein [Planktothrix agardhii 1030]